MDEKIIALWGQISTSILTQLIFAVLAFLAFWLRNEQMELLVVGAAIANATTVVNYWLGSSSGSKGKDATIAGQAESPAPPKPPTTIISP